MFWSVFGVVDSKDVVVSPILPDVVTSKLEDWEVISEERDTLTSSENTEGDEYEGSELTKLFIGVEFSTSYIPEIIPFESAKVTYKNILLKNVEKEAIKEILLSKSKEGKSWKPQIVVEDEPSRHVNKLFGNFNVANPNLDSIEFDDDYYLSGNGCWDMIDNEMEVKYSRPISRVKCITLLRPCQIIQKEMRIHKKALQQQASN